MVLKNNYGTLLRPELYRINSHAWNAILRTVEFTERPKYVIKGGHDDVPPNNVSPIENSWTFHPSDNVSLGQAAL
jgi:hypothetical protein